MAFCGKCGTELRKGARFCHRCGQKAGSATVPAAPRTAEPAPEPVSVPVPQPEPVYVPERGYPQEFYGPSCYYHTMEPAVVQCARCGKPICRDCAEAYGVTAGDFAGMCLCYDCCTSLVADNLKLLKQQKRQILTTFILTIVGILVGLAVSASSETPAVIIVVSLWFGSFWVWFKTSILAFFSKANSKTNGSFFWGAVIGGLITAPFKTVIKLIRCIVYLRRTSSAVADDTDALEQMKDYMEYTQILSQNPGMAPEILMEQDSRLQNNAYARVVMAQGEAEADAQLRRYTASIASNRETLENFSL